MKLILSTVFAVAFVSAASAKTVNFDGCEGKLVPGTNYYNFVDPRCVTESAKFSSSKGEDKRAEAKKE